MNSNDRQFLDKFIVPNFYKPEHLGIQKWSPEKIEDFKQYVIDTINWEGEDNTIYRYMLSLIIDFEKNDQKKN